MNSSNSVPGDMRRGQLIYRQRFATRLAHWVWAVSLFFLLTSGLQIFNAHPALYLGDQSARDHANAILRIDAGLIGGEPEGYVEVFGRRFITTGVLGLRGEGLRIDVRAFGPALTLPSYQDLATGRVVHFFFAWLLVAALLLWFMASLLNGHLRHDLWPAIGDLRSLPGELAGHLRFRFHRGVRYNVLQKLSYGGVLFVLLPLMVATGLAMSPGFDAVLPWLTELFGGRQSARSVHFLVMLLLAAFFIVHMLMVLAAGPLNELRAIVTGWYRTAPQSEGLPHD